MDNYVDRVRLVADVVNTVDVFADEELLDSPDDLIAFAGDHGISGREITRSELERFRRARAALRDALTSGDEAEAVAGVNGVMAGIRARPRLVEDPDGTWTFTYADPDSPVVDRILAEAAAGALEEIRDHGLRRFSTCASSTCDDLFLDQSRNHSRRYCTPDVCGNREAQRAYRARQAERGE